MVVTLLKFLADNFGGGANIQKVIYGIGADSKSNQFGVGELLWTGKVDVLVTKISLGFSVQEIVRFVFIENNAFSSIYGLKSTLKNGALGMVKLGGDVEKLNVDAFNGVTRAKNGDIGCVVTLLKFLADNFGGGANIQKVIYGIGADSKSNQFGVGELLWKGKVIGISLGFSVQEIVRFIFTENNAFSSIYGLKSTLKNGALGMVKLGGDVEKLNVDAFNGVTRAKNGDIGCVVTLLKFLADNFGGGANIQKVVFGIGQDSKSNQFGVGELLWKGKVIGISLGFSVQEIVRFIFTENNAFSSIYGLKSTLKNGALGMVKLGGDVEKLNVDAFNGVTRAKNGDIGCVVTLLKFLADNFGGGANIQKVVFGIGQDSKSNQFGVGELLWKGKVIGISLGFSVQEIVNTIFMFFNI